ncbi:CysS/YqeB C-terminal domain-containing protein [Bradyrhizobium barranii]
MDERSIQYFSLAGPITDISVGQIMMQRDDGSIAERIRVAQSNGQSDTVSELRKKIESWGVNVSLENGVLSITSRGDDGSIESKIESLIADRAAARTRKDFQESDRIRDELAAMGVVLKDGKDAEGRPTTTWEVAR